MFICVPLWPLLTPACALAQETQSDVVVTVSGDVELDYIYQEAALIEAAARTVGGTADDEADTGKIEGRIRLRLDVEIDAQVSATLELGSFRDPTRPGATGGGGVFGNNGETADVGVTEAALRFKDAVLEDLTISAGVLPCSFNIRGTGGSLVFDPRWSDNYFTTTSPLGTAGATNLPMGSDELQPTGITGALGDLTLFLLPALVEGGRSTDDEAAYGIAWYARPSGLGAGSRIGVLAMLVNSVRPDPLTSDDGKAFAVYTVGGGANLVGLGDEDLTIFAEAYRNLGTAGRDASGDAIDAQGFAFQVGARYGGGTWAEAKLTYFSGDDDFVDEDEDNFLSYESLSDLRIVEDQYFGLNLRSNYFALKLSAGTSSAGLDLWSFVGICRASEDVTLGAAEEDRLGTEIDVNARGNINKQAAVTVGVAVLLGSDILERLTIDQENRTWLFTLGADLRF